MLVWGFHFESFSFVFVLLWILFLFVFNESLFLRFVENSKFISKLALFKETEFSYTLGL